MLRSCNTKTILTWRTPFTFTSVRSGARALTSSSSPESATSTIETYDPLDDEDYDAKQAEWQRRRWRTDAKRRQRGETFMDQRIVHVRGGRGGDGCAAFHREKWKPMGPPSGGNGGSGSSVYLLPTSHLTTLSSVPRIVKGAPGGPGGGTWRNGKDAPPTIVRVPLGTVVKQLVRDDPRRAWDADERFERKLDELNSEERVKKIRERRWVHYPGFEDDNLKRDIFLDADEMLEREERMLKARQENRGLIHLDLDRAVETPESEKDPDAPLGLPRAKNWGYLIAEGGAGGLGNPHFFSKTNRSPKTATRGREGEWLTLELELKILADVALVGKPNAGKSTLVRALTGGRAKSEIAGWAFTTLNPVVGVVRVGEEGWIGGREGAVYGETAGEGEMLREGMSVRGYVGEEGAEESRGAEDVEGTASVHTRPDYETTIGETFRFTITDNPGLIEDASENRGLGHAFLRSIERSHALVYVVDLAGDAPWEELRVLRGELEKYAAGLSGRARMVLANKADAIGQGGVEEVEEAREKLERLEEWVRKEMRDEEGRELDVVPVSGKYGMNLRKVVDLMRGYVEVARRRVAVRAEEDGLPLDEDY